MRPCLAGLAMVRRARIKWSWWPRRAATPQRARFQLLPRLSSYLSSIKHSLTTHQLIMSSSPPTAGLPEGSIPIPSLTLEVDSDDADHIASEGTERLLGKLKNIKGIGNIDRVSQNTGKRIVIAYGTLDACPKFVRTGNHMGKGILKSIADDLGCTQPLRHFRQPYYLEVLDFPNPPSPGEIAETWQR